MYGKTQESGLTAIIPAIRISAPRGRHSAIGFFSALVPGRQRQWQRQRQVPDSCWTAGVVFSWLYAWTLHSRLSLSHEALHVERKVRREWELAALSGFQLVYKKIFKANHLPRLQGKPFIITGIQVHGPSIAEESEVERFYEDLQDFLELTPKKESFSL